MRPHPRGWAAVGWVEQHKGVYARLRGLCETQPSVDGPAKHWVSRGRALDPTYVRLTATYCTISCTRKQPDRPDPSAALRLRSFFHRSEGKTMQRKIISGPARIVLTLGLVVPVV